MFSLYYLLHLLLTARYNKEVRIAPLKKNCCRLTWTGVQRFIFRCFVARKLYESYAESYMIQDCALFKFDDSCLILKHKKTNIKRLKILLFVRKRSITFNRQLLCLKNNVTKFIINFHHTCAEKAIQIENVTGKCMDETMRQNYIISLFPIENPKSIVISLKLQVFLRSIFLNYRISYLIVSNNIDNFEKL